MTTQPKFLTRAIYYASIVSLLLFIFSCENKPSLEITTGNLVFEMNDQMQTKITSTAPDSKPYMNGFQASEILSLKESDADKFKIESIATSVVESENFGSQWTITGNYSSNGVIISKKEIITSYDDFPGILSIQVEYVNNSKKSIYVRDWRNHNYKILSQNDDPGFWAFQGSSSDERDDWIKPLKPGYYKENYMGMNNSDYGGGIPVTSVWRKDAGIAIGHLETKPTLISLPTELPLEETDAQISVAEFFDYPTLFEANDTISTPETFILVHQGDYYNALMQYSAIMQSKGIIMPEAEDAAYEPIWCAWGYERNFTLDEVIGTLPKVKELGIKWAVLDDGFQIAEGDWDANPDKFPRGNIEIKEMVDKIHSYDLKAKIWWTPLAADPTSKALADQPDMRLFTEDWSPQFITWWDAYYLSPVNELAINHTKEILNLFIDEWGFDGLKMDGQHMNAVQPDHNPASNLEYPEQAVEGVPDFFKMVYDYTKEKKHNAVIENCPCGTCMSFFNMPAMNQAVSSDPESSWQIRHKGKTYKALIPNTAYYGDHVELSDNGNDFATSFGIGAVLGTKFTWPKDNPTASESFLLTPEKEIIWKKWFDLYNEKMLSKGEYLGGLYDIGFDKPEAHVIAKGESMYYAFYADDWNGDITLKGLSEGEFSVKDYFNNTDFANIQSSSPTLNVSFNDFLLLEVTSTK